MNLLPVPSHRAVWEMNGNSHRLRRSSDHQTKTVQKLFSAFLAEKTRTPPRIFLWWCCFYEANLRKAPSGRELAPKATEGERVTIKLIKTQKSRRLLPPPTREPPKLISFVSGNPAAVPLPLGGRLWRATADRKTPPKKNPWWCSCFLR